MTEESLDKKVLDAAISARRLLEEDELDPYTRRESVKMLRACEEYFLFLGKPEARFTKLMLRSYERKCIGQQPGCVQLSLYDVED